MAKVINMTEQLGPDISGLEWLYLVDNTADKKARISALKTIFSSTVNTLADLQGYQGLKEGQVVFLLGGTTTNDENVGTEKVSSADLS